MKRLILVRHGKSSREHDVKDIERPLKNRGGKDGNLIAGAFEKYNDRILQIWTSPAVRAYSTAKIFKQKLNLPDEDFHIHNALYTFNSEDLLKEITTCPQEIDTLMVFGHNPATTNLVNYLGNSYFDNIPTTGLTLIDFETDDWKNIATGKTILSLFPKNLR